MTLLTRLASATLAGLCVVGMAGAAFAHHIPQQPFVEAETLGLMRSARATGIQIFTETDPSTRGRCRQGLYGMANNSNQLLICVTNHGDDMDELADTIRHELIHNAQYCKGRGKGELLFPQHKEKFLRIARDVLHMPMDKYDAKQYYAEAEARVLAQILEEDKVAELLREHCS